MYCPWALRTYTVLAFEPVPSFDATREAFLLDDEPVILSGCVALDGLSPDLTWLALVCIFWMLEFIPSVPNEMIELLTIS